MNQRTGFTVNAAFVLGVLGALLVIAGAALPQLSIPGHAPGPLVDPMALVDDPVAGLRDAGTAVVVFALFAIGFCMVGRYYWLIFCALMIVLFLAVALTRQLTDMLGLTIPQIVDMYNGVLPPDIDASALLEKLPVLQATTYDQGLLVLGIGLMMIELAPWLRRFRTGGGWQTVASLRKEPKAVGSAAYPAVAAAAQPAPEPALPTRPDLLLDDLYIFADGLDQPLSFALLDPAGMVSRHRMVMEAAGYLGDAYYLRCRDAEAGNRRDVPAHLMSEIVDERSGAPVDTDDMLDDLARVAYEAVSGELEADDPHDADRAPDTAPADDREPVFPVTAPSQARPVPEGTG